MEEIIQKLNELEQYKGDPEAAHFYADQALLEFVEDNAPEVHAAYTALRAKCDGWWYA